LHVDDGFTAREYGGDGTLGLAQVLAAAHDEAADLVVVAGDFFEHNRVPASLLDRTARLLADAGMPVVILPGNHDPAIDQSAFQRGALDDIEGVHILGVTDEDAVLFPDWDLEVWGHAHRDYYDMTPLRAPRPRTTRWQIATAHGHYEPAPDYGDAPHPSWLISDAEIAATGADYVALGHWNRAQRVGNGEVRAHYSGSPDLAGTVNVVRLTVDGEVRVTPRPVG
jgi:DNA repair exonuclease SbcCD nuclease subunit